MLKNYENENKRNVKTENDMLGEHHESDWKELCFSFWMFYASHYMNSFEIRVRMGKTRRSRR